MKHQQQLTVKAIDATSRGNRHPIGPEPESKANFVHDVDSNSLSNCTVVALSADVG